MTRGLLVDIAAYKGLDQLAEAYEVTLADVRGALKGQGQSEDDLQPGDALLFRYGWESRWKDESMDLLNAPGIGLEVGRWIVERKLSLVGGDVGPEVFPNPDPDLYAPIHQELVTKNGIFLLESMALDELASDRVYEFLFIFTPLRIKGATGSPHSTSFLVGRDCARSLQWPHFPILVMIITFLIYVGHVFVHIIVLIYAEFD